MGLERSDFIFDLVQVLYYCPKTVDCIYSIATVYKIKIQQKF